MLNDIELRFVQVLTGNEVLEDGTWTPTSWERRLQFRKQYSVETPIAVNTYWTDWKDVPMEGKP